jgi:hypothetical protein
MQEDDIGAVLAAAAPEAVPVVTDLQHRARTLGRRRRRQRNVLSVGGAGVAVVAVAGAALAFGGAGGQADGSAAMHAGSETAGAPSTGSANGTSGTAGTTGATGTAGSPTKASDFVRSNFKADAVVDTVNALLPKGDVVKEVSTPSAGGRKFTTDLVVAMPSGALFTLTVSASAATGGAAGTCPAHATCATGTAQVLGHEAGWSSFEQSDSLPTGKPTGTGASSETVAGPHVEGLTIVDSANDYRIDLASTGKGPGFMPTVEELKRVGLDDRFVSAVLATRK